MARRAISVAAQVADEALPGRVTRWRQSEATASPRIGPARRHKRASGACSFRASAPVEAVVDARPSTGTTGGPQDPTSAVAERCGVSALSDRRTEATRGTLEGRRQL